MTQPDFPMPYGLLWQYRLLVYIQSFHSPILDKIAILLSSLGIESFYIFVLPIIFWGVHKRNGLRLAYIFLTSMYVNAWLKVVFHLARPIGIPGIRSGYVSSATSFSMPSGHAQGPMTFFAVIARMVKRKWILIVGSVLVLAIGLSRLYLGLHWPLDVILGWVLGLIIGLIGWSFAKWWTYRQMSFPARLFLAIAFPVILYAIHHDALSSGFLAFLLSIGVGAVVEGEWLHSDLDKALWKRICVIIIGIAGLIAIQWGMKWTSGSTVWILVRDCAIGIWATVIAPWVFVLCGLYHREGTHHAD